MKQRASLALGAVVLVIGASAWLACGPSKPPADAPSATAIASASASASAPATASAAPPPATIEKAPSPAMDGQSQRKAEGSSRGSGAPLEPGESVGVTTVSNEITTPNVISPDKVIQSIRPKFNACFNDGLKKDPKTAGSVTLSAKIDKDGKVSAVTPKLLNGFSAAVVKCLSDGLKTASFAPAGGMNYTTSIDIPLSFSSNP